MTTYKTFTDYFAALAHITSVEATIRFLGTSSTADLWKVRDGEWVVSHTTTH
jgi:hypothetical protein